METVRSWASVSALAMGLSLLTWQVHAQDCGPFSGTVAVTLLGDSITQGDDDHETFRRPLWQLLEGINADVDFVGSLDTNFEGPNPTPDFDLDHEGHWGWTAQEILDGIGADGDLQSWLSGYTPDIVLLHIGHNDLKADGTSEDVSDDTLARVDQIIDLLRADNADVCVLLAQLIPSRRSPRNVNIPVYNDLIPPYAAGKSTTASPIVVVDHFTGFDTFAHTYDGTHPNADGEALMAQRWFDTLAPLLSVVQDSDADGVSDASDNCLDVPNNAQTDGDADGFGNRCDADLNNDCAVDFLDLALLKDVIFTSDASADFNVDGQVDFLDFADMKALFLMAPGPSGQADCGS